MKNFTGGEKLQTVAELWCSAELTREVHGKLKVQFWLVKGTCTNELDRKL